MVRALAIAFTIAACGASLGSARADAAFDRCVRKLCVSTSQPNCWIKAGAAMCDREQIVCKELPDHAPAKVVTKVGSRWEVITKFGRGWVSDRMTMVDGGKC